METVVKILLGITSVIGLGVIGWRLWTLRWDKVLPPVITSSLAQCRTADDVVTLRAICEQNPSPLGRLLLQAANHLDWPKSDNVLSLETAARHEIVRLERGLVVLEIIVGIAPLLGLVGTIIGMITVFGDLGATGLNTVSDASKLAQGISYILWTTLIGLLISIPSLIAWSYFTKKVEVLAVEIEALCDEFVRTQYRDKNP
jgi:biopolymer transport protein ExbB